MENKSPDRIFLDMDDTLIASYYSERPAMTKQIIESFRYDYDYFVMNHNRAGQTVVVIREWAHALVAACKELVGDMNVALLTRSGIGFALPVMRQTHMGINEDRIYTREDLHYDVPMFKESNNILVDNECYEYHLEGPMSKSRFLYGLKRDNLIQVYPFDAMGHEPDPAKYLYDLVQRITKSLKTKP